MKKYTNEELIESARRFSTRAEWRKHDGGKQRQTAQARGIMDQCCAHMTDARTQKKHTTQEIIDEARKYANSTEWRRAHKSRYLTAIRYGILHLCTAHMPRKDGIYSGIYQVYAYQFPDNTAYIGLTCVPEQRHAQHKGGGRVLAKAIQLGIDVPEPVILSDHIMSPQEGQEQERMWIDHFKQEGWTTLNVAKGGSVGAIGKVIVSKWTKEKVLEIARRFHTTRDWVQFDSASYAAASRNGWLTECTAHMVKLESWTEERIQEVASRYSSVDEFSREQTSCMVVAKRKGIYFKVTAHMTRKILRERSKRALAFGSTIG